MQNTVYTPTNYIFQSFTFYFYQKIVEAHEDGAWNWGISAHGILTGADTKGRPQGPWPTSTLCGPVHRADVPHISELSDPSINFWIPLLSFTHAHRLTHRRTHVVELCQKPKQEMTFGPATRTNEIT